MNFVGREKEITEIKNSYISDKSEFVAVYGRRRIGKTFLIKNVLEDKFDFYYTGIYKQIKSNQLLKFNMTLQQYGYLKDSTVNNWFDAFKNLKEYLLSLNKKTVCVFIDELPWMDSKNSNFVQSFSDFWNMWDSFNPNHVLLKLYVCGSGTTWMINKIIADKGGLHNRLTNSIHLKQFTLKECQQYYKECLNLNLSVMEVLDIYMTVGGIPYYLSKFNKQLPVSNQIDQLFFSNNAPLKDEFQYLYEALFNDSKSYKKIITALCSKYKGFTRDELAKLTKIEGGTLSECLENLENCDFVRKYYLPNNIKKDAIYQITDLYTIFYLKFVNKNHENENYWESMLESSSVLSWKGFAFERVLLLHTDLIKKALGISGISSNIYGWNSKNDKDNYQIDLIIDRADNIMNICEIKYSSGLYKITKQYNDYIHERINSFRNEIKTKKTLKNTFITTFGLDTENGFMPDASITLNELLNS